MRGDSRQVCVPDFAYDGFVSSSYYPGALPNLLDYKKIRRQD
jgi:hypothetical protein